MASTVTAGFGDGDCKDLQAALIQGGPSSMKKLPESNKQPPQNREASRDL